MQNLYIVKESKTTYCHLIKTNVNKRVGTLGKCVSSYAPWVYDWEVDDIYDNYFINGVKFQILIIYYFDEDGLFAGSLYFGIKEGHKLKKRIERRITNRLRKRK